MKGVGRLDIQPYLHHIGINPERVSDRKALFRDIQRRHLLTVPFENLDIHLKHPLSMDPVKVQEKVAVHKRGGLCFELNSLLGAVYRELGYQVHYVSAAFWNEDKHDWNPPYSHLALNVNVEGKTYLADVGVGGGFMEPIEIRHGMVYEDHLATYRLEQQVIPPISYRSLRMISGKSCFNFQPNRRSWLLFSQCVVTMKQARTPFLVKRDFAASQQRMGGYPFPRNH